MANSFIEELKRRNVFKVSISYLLLGWIVLQVADIVVPILDLPEWTLKALLFFGIIGFPFAIFLAWAYELTPDGIKKDSEVTSDSSITSTTSKKLNIVISILLVISLTYIFYTDSVESPSPEKDMTTEGPIEVTPSIAVLPFINMSGNNENEYFSDGLTETLLHKLAQVDEINVAARTSSFAFKDKNSDIRVIAQALGVANVLEGSVQRSGDKVRITAQLIQAETGYHLWSKVFDRELDDIFTVQDDIAAEVAAALSGSLLDKKVVSTGGETSNTEAYDLYLKGRNELYDRNADRIESSIQHMRRAIELDPEFALAWVGLSEALIAEATYSGRGYDNSNIDEIISSAEKAVVLAPDNIMTQVHLGNVYRDWNDYEKSRIHLEKALAIDSEYAPALTAISELLWDEGRYLDAIEYSERAMAIDPLNWRSKVEAVNNYSVLGRVEDAEMLARSIVDHDPDYIPGLSALGNVYWRTGRHVEAFRIYHRMLEINPKTDYIIGRISYSFMALSDMEKSLHWLNKAEQINADRYLDDKSEIFWFQNKKEDSITTLKDLLVILKNDEEPYMQRIFRIESEIARRKEDWQTYYEITLKRIDWYKSENRQMSYWLRAQLNINMALALKKLGRPVDTIIEELIAYLQDDFSNGSNSQYHWRMRSLVYAIQGDASLAIDALEKAYKKGYREEVFILHNPIYDEIRDNTKMQKLLDTIAENNRLDLERLLKVENELGSFD